MGVLSCFVLSCLVLPFFVFVCLFVCVCLFVFVFLVLLLMCGLGWEVGVVGGWSGGLVCFGGTLGFFLLGKCVSL